MNGAHDMGGMDGFGPVMPASDEPLFHAAWERRAFALTFSRSIARQIRSACTVSRVRSRI